MKKLISWLLPVLLFIAGLGMLLYPLISDYWNSLHMSQAIVEYKEAVSEIDPEEYARQLEAAQAFNDRLTRESFSLSYSEDMQETYESLLDISGNGIMGYIEIPKINVELPVYHGTGEDALRHAAGHLEGTSLPVGGESTHTVISGHRGLPSARLFTDVDMLNVGDIFILNVLDQTLTYEVDEILQVLPDEIESLYITEGEDLCTLVTCTPYGVNSHRLLVRGHRVSNRYVPSPVEDARQLSPIVMSLTVLTVLGLVLIAIYFMDRHKKKKASRIREAMHSDAG